MKRLLQKIINTSGDCFWCLISRSGRVVNEKKNSCKLIKWWSNLSLLCFHSSLGATHKKRYRKNQKTHSNEAHHLESSIGSKITSSARSRWMKVIKKEDDDRRRLARRLCKVESWLERMKVGENLENKQFCSPSRWNFTAAVQKLWRNRMSEMLICETLSNRFHPGEGVCCKLNITYSAINNPNNGRSIAVEKQKIRQRISIETVIWTVTQSANDPPAMTNKATA